MRIVVFESVTLDGVMQAPGREDEDPRGGFRHGGWATPYSDEVLGKVAGEGMAKSGALLLGRRTYEDFYGFWPNQPEDNPFTAVLNNAEKYVTSRTLQEPLPWSNSTLLAGDAVESVAKLKQGPGADVVVLGSGQLVRSLMAANLIDEWVLLVHPLVLGSGIRLFPDGGPNEALQLIDSKTTTKGVVIATYQPANQGQEKPPTS